jgi:DMSO/TMAO reductase YedYZ molybdopterin-dependent catalytic subunit
VASQVQTITIPPNYNQIATYPIAVVKGSQNATLAQKFVDYVLSPAGQTALTNAGFITNSSVPKASYSPTVQVTGLVSKTLTLRVSDLKKMPATTVTVTQRTDIKVLGTHRYTGALLNDVIQAAIPISNTSFKNDPLRMFATIRATDNYQVTVAMAEILPAFGHQQILLAYAQDGKPLAYSDGAVELIVPGDTLAGRDVRNVDEIVVGTPLGNI